MAVRALLDSRGCKRGACRSACAWWGARLGMPRAAFGGCRSAGRTLIFSPDRQRY